MSCSKTLFSNKRMMVQGNALFSKPHSIAQSTSNKLTRKLFVLMLEILAMDWWIVCYELMIDQRCLLALHRTQVKRKARVDNFLGFLFLFFFQKPYTVDVMNTYNVFSGDLHSHLKNDTCQFHVTISCCRHKLYKAIQLHFIWNSSWITYPSVRLSNRRLCTGDPGAELLVVLAGGSVCPCSREIFPALPGSL